MATAPGIHRPVRGQSQSDRQRDQQRWRGTSASRGYDSRWRRARERHFAAYPLCVCCEAQGRVSPARILDHVIPHKGDSRLFWDPHNWQGLCDWCDRHIKTVIETMFEREEIEADELRLDRPLETVAGGRFKTLAEALGRPRE